MRRSATAGTIEGNYRDWRDLAAYRDEAARCRRQLTLLKAADGGVGLRLFSVMRNEKDFIPRFLEHYRRLGIAHFVIVDNDSTDSSRDLLMQQPDVELHHAAASYAAANGGTLWLDGLMHEQARDQWVVHVDADELLVYDQCERRPLADLVRVLSANGEGTLLAPLVDLYPDPGCPEQLYFDASAERRRPTNRGPHIEGGPRSRMAALHGHQTYPCLTKYPLVRYTSLTAYANTHFPYPAQANSHRILGRLLHLKLTSRFKEKVDQALREGQHWNGGSEYRIYAEWLGGDELRDLRTGESRRYTGPQDLIAAGLMEPIDWRRSTGLLSRMAVRLSRRQKPGQ
jgi:Glycosyl transferase family 2